MNFRRDMKKARARAVADTERKIGAAAAQLFGHIIRRTPVDKGALRGNWQVGLGEIPNSPVDRLDKTGAQAIADAVTAAAKFKITGTLYFVNNLPYAPVVERGSSKQAPAGMVAVSVNDFRKYFRSQGGLS